MSREEICKLPADTLLTDREVAEMIGVFFAALCMVFPIIWLHQAYGLGGAELPAPQAGLMAMMAKGIVAQQMAWPFVGCVTGHLMKA